MKDTYIYVSSWTHGKGDGGILLFRMDENTGELKYEGKEISGVDFNVSVFDERRRILYALDTAPRIPLERSGGGRIFAFKADAASGHLTEICCVPTWSRNPAYLSFDKSGRYLVAANHAGRNAVSKIRRGADGRFYPYVEYDDSTVELFSVNADGTIGELLDVVCHHGSGPEWRQTNAHPHSCELSPDGRYFAVCDKGCDTVTLYSIDTSAGRLIQAGNIVRHEPGTLPRYCKFHPKLPYFYHNCEADMHIHAFRYYENGRLEKIGAFSALPDGYAVREEGQEIYEQQGLVMHPDGRFLYDVARGPGTVAVFEILPATGELRRIQDVFTEKRWPRGIAMSPSGRFLLLCSVESSDITVYRVAEDGRLYSTGHSAQAECAAWAAFWSP